MSTRRWDPFDEILALRESLDRRLGLAGGRAPASSVARERAQGWRPAIDMWDAADAVLVRIAVPGVAPGDVDLQVGADWLSVRGVVPEPHPGPGVFHAREIRHGAWACTLALPPGLAPDGATALYRHGVVEVRIPKARGSAPRAVVVDVQD